MKILVRLPNWLGDLVMASAALKALEELYPGARVDVIVKKGLEALVPLLPNVQQQYVFSKEEHRGLKGLWAFGRSIRRKDQYDLFISFPDSFSSAFMGYASGARERIGYSKELRNFLLTRSFVKPKLKHRVEEYLDLVHSCTGKGSSEAQVQLHHSFKRKHYIVVNINSEASSRRLTTPKAISLLTTVLQETEQPLVLIGAPKEAPFVESVMQLLPPQFAGRVSSEAGKTSLGGLVQLLAEASAMLSTDSGPAHLANALGTPVTVLFGAGNENNTAPWNKEDRTIIRLGKLSCEPCVRNECVQFPTPQCLELLDEQVIVSSLTKMVKHG